MFEIALTKLSSKGQIVLPKEMRRGLRRGEKFVVIKAGNRFVVKKAKLFGRNLQEDLDFARKTEEAWESYERGEFTRSTAEEFLKELKTW